ncbi:MAG: hypothetical protein ACO3ZW_00110 [Opitutales bacterium]|jgi:hypothetical protein
MSGAWIYLWVLMLLTQLLTVWASRRIAGELDLPPVPGDPELLQLATVTNQQWRILAGFSTGSAGGGRKGTGEDLLVRREELLLKLKDIEEVLGERGGEFSLAEDLQAYLAVAENSGNPATINAYLDGLIKWMEPHVELDSLSRLQKLAIYPGTNATLPLFSFELGGDPRVMGSLLLESSSLSPGWALQEMDLVLSGGWDGWIRGSCAFLGNSPPQW